jgi:hypothetical protein
MPRTGQRRVTVGTSVAIEDAELIDAIAAEAGVKRSDVARFGLELVLRAISRNVLVEVLAERGRESAEPITGDQAMCLRDF